MTDWCAVPTRSVTTRTVAADRSSDSECATAATRLGGGIPFPATTRIRRSTLPAPRNETGLPNHVKGAVEQLSGFDLDPVRVHYGPTRPDRFDAVAYAAGRDIEVAAGAQHHVAHEAWHVVQQLQGPTQP
jgi:hypothetical protein